MTTNVKNRIVIERTANPNFRKWHLNTQISECDGAESFHRSLKEAGESLVQIGGIGKKLVEALFGIDGIEGLNVSTYEIEIAKGTAFLWSDIEPKAIEILKTAFGEEEVEVLNQRWLCHVPEELLEDLLSSVIPRILLNNITDDADEEKETGEGTPNEESSGEGGEPGKEVVDEISDVKPTGDENKPKEETGDGASVETAVDEKVKEEEAGDGTPDDETACDGEGKRDKTVIEVTNIEVCDDVKKEEEKIEE